MLVRRGPEGREKGREGVGGRTIMAPSRTSKRVWFSMIGPERRRADDIGSGRGPEGEQAKRRHTVPAAEKFRAPVDRSNEDKEGRDGDPEQHQLCVPLDRDVARLEVDGRLSRRTAADVGASLPPPGEAGKRVELLGRSVLEVPERKLDEQVREAAHDDHLEDDAAGHDVPSRVGSRESVGRGSDPSSCTLDDEREQVARAEDPDVRLGVELRVLLAEVADQDAEEDVVGRHLEGRCENEHADPAKERAWSEGGRTERAKEKERDSLSHESVWVRVPDPAITRLPGG